MTHPDSPKNPTQKYYLTDYGKVLLNDKMDKKRQEGVHEEKINSMIGGSLTDEEKRIALELLQKG